ncbi:AsmA-like C-terminal region-containing protein [Propionivibrio sp.]|uniref:AsmA-like C-terminal region-containing protein n=1 Tax=Propionivibrio sp. TaxID=2212460 RepID=UPI003BF36E48
MDPNLIYAKTASGEGAMYQRTRVMQRNVRMILILVDGQSTVADLSLKTGNPQLTENALFELEKSGFIEPRLEQDSLWAESKKVAHEIRTAAINKVIQIASPGTKDVPEPPASEIPMSIHSEFKTPPPGDDLQSQFSVAQMQSLGVSGGQLPPVLVQEGPKKSSEEQTKTSTESRPSFVERVKALLQNVRRRNDDADSIGPIRRGKASSMSWPMMVIFGFFGVLALAFLTLGFFPYDSYLPTVEVALAQASGRSAKVGSMRVELYPKPGLFLGNVRIGAGKDEMRIAEIRLQPKISTLFSSRKVFREAVLIGVPLPPDLIAGLPGVFVAMADPSARVGVEHISLEKADVLFGGLGFSGMDGEAKLSAQGLFQSFLLRSPDRSLSFEAKPITQGFEFALEGFGWRPYQGSPFLFDSLSLKGVFQNSAVTINSMDLRLFDGQVRGGAVLRDDAEASISGEILFERISAARFGDALGFGQQFAGQTSGKIRFSTTSDSWASIFSVIEADGEFAMSRGSIRGIDLTEAVRRVSKAPVQGGATLFENLSGKIKLTPTNYQFPELVLNSGLMQSTGHIEVSKDLKVSGKMELEMHGTVNQTRVPISISGPLKTPVVQVGKN